MYGWTQGYIANSHFTSINTCCEYHVSCAPMGWWTSSASTFNYKPIRYDKDKKPIPMPALVMVLGEKDINQRSYIQSPLLCPLQAGHTYILDIEYGYEDLHFDEIGIYFSDSFIHIPKKEVYKIDSLTGSFRKYYVDSLLPFTPQIQAKLNTHLLSPRKKTLRMEYTAKGSERFILLGNFQSDEKTSFRKSLFSRPNEDRQLFAFYQVSLTELDGPGCDCEKQIEKLNTLNRRHTFLGACSDTTEVDMNHLFDGHGRWEIRREQEGGQEEEKEVIKRIEIGKAYRIEGIYFDFDSTILKPSSYPALDSLVMTLRQFPEYRVEIVGHTDSLGSDEYNLQLSQDRAEAVRQYLIQKGMNATMLRAEGMGNSRPLRSNDSEEGRQKNRRVEFIIQKDKDGTY